MTAREHAFPTSPGSAGATANRAPSTASPAPFFAGGVVDGLTFQQLRDGASRGIGDATPVAARLEAQRERAALVDDEPADEHWAIVATRAASEARLAEADRFCGAARTHDEDDVSGVHEGTDSTVTGSVSEGVYR